MRAISTRYSMRWTVSPACPRVQRGPSGILRHVQRFSIGRKRRDIGHEGIVRHLLIPAGIIPRHHQGGRRFHRFGKRDGDRYHCGGRFGVPQLVPDGILRLSDSGKRCQADGQDLRFQALVLSYRYYRSRVRRLAVRSKAVARRRGEEAPAAPLRPVLPGTEGQTASSRCRLGLRYRIKEGRIPKRKSWFQSIQPAHT